MTVLAYKMKNYLISFFLFITHLCLGQTNHLHDDKINTKFKFLYIVKFHNKPSMVTENAFIDPSEKDTVYSLPNLQCKEICDLLKVNAIIVFRVKAYTKVLTLNEVFNLYNIREKYRKFEIRIDDEVINYPETILISKSQIDKVNTIKDKNYYINIILKGYYEFKKKYPKGGGFVD